VDRRGAGVAEAQSPIVFARSPRNPSPNDRPAVVSLTLEYIKSNESRRAGRNRKKPAALTVIYTPKVARLTSDEGPIWFDPMSQRILVWLLATSVCGSGGCASPRRGDYQSLRPVSIAEPSEDADQLWEAVQETLRRGRFQIDRVDRASGVVTTLPETSQHYFEFWRHDVDTQRDAWEATLNPMRRWVEVSLTRADDGPWTHPSELRTRLAVVVHKERLTSPDRQFNSSGAAYQYFGEGLPSTTGKSKVTAKEDHWLDCGRDPAMEDYLLRKILERSPSEVASTAETSPGS